MPVTQIGAQSFPGSTGDPPDPSGDPPDGVGKTFQLNRDGPFARLLHGVPFGGSPTGANRWPALPIFRTCCLLLSLLWFGCSRESSAPPASTRSGIETNDFAVLETELSPAILVHSKSKYLGLFGETNVPLHIAISTRTGPRPFRRGERLKADELEECWLLLWGPETPAWVVYLQHKPLALSLDTNGLHFSFANGAGDVVLLPLHGSSTNIDTKKWSEFLLREPLMRVRYWASVLREFPIECQTTVTGNTVHQKFRFHSIRDDWNTRPLQLAPMSPPLAIMADEKLKRTLRELEMPTPFGAYLGFEGVPEWAATFPKIRASNECAWASLGNCEMQAPNTILVHGVQTNGWPRIAEFGLIRPERDQPPPAVRQDLLSVNSRLFSYR